MSPVCHSFVQNAWKKDFCSNCFKSREEHVKQDKTTEGGKYLATPLQNRIGFFKKTPPSILKNQTKKINKRNVRFPEEVSSVIGYGGDDWSDGEEFEVSEDNEDEDIFPDTEEERELYKITKSNTDFNTVKANLLGDSVAKSYTSLMLGKVQTDSDGKKKTLMVSVTPFGQENKNSNVKTHTRKPAVIHINEAQAEEAASNFKTNIILTSYIKESETIVTSESVRSTEGICTEKSLLEEISETLQQNRMNNGNNINLSHNNNNKPTVIEEKRKESMQDEVEKKEMTETRKNGIVRKSPLIKTQERPKVNLNRSEFKFCKINIENNSVDSAVGTLNSTANNSLTSDDESFSAKTDSDNDDSGHFSETNKCEETVKIKVFNESEKSNKISPIRRLRQADGKAGSGYSTFQSPIIDMPPIIPKQSDSVFSAEASRELAGEPDGRADPDESSEAPALPNSPVPTMDPRPSFLHGIITDIMPSKPAVPEKPKLPTKPVIKQTTKKSMTTSNQIIHTHGTKQIEEEKSRYSSEEKNNQIKEVHQVKTETIYYAKPVLTKQDSDTSLNSLCKRKAPTPPISPTEEYPNNLYQRNQSGFMKSDSPVVRELEKRERAVISSSPKTRTLEDIDKKDSQPEPAPRRSISLSHDNLLLDDKRKGKLKFSIKKLLRIGSSKDLDKKELSVATVTKVSHKTEEIYDLTPKPKPRLVIIHPLDINGSSVEVVKSNCEISESLRRMSHDDVSIYSGCSSVADVETAKILSKPPPPPRTSSDDANSSTIPKPARPPPPKSAALQKKQKQQTWSPTLSKTDNIYANLGEIRSALAPRKPERTASMRERESHLELLKRRAPLDDDKDELDGQQELVQATNDTVIHSYDDVYNSGKYDEEACDSAKNSDSDYEYVHHARSSSPECDAAIKPSKVNMEIRPDTKIEETNVEFPKYNNSFNRSSLPYCGSETESEIYSPYSFYNSNDNMDGSTNDDYQNEMTPKTTTNKLRVRKGRSVVHKNLEDNYGAVVIANHEALAQVLEQVQQSATMQPSLRGLKACTNLRWSDFNVQPLNKGFTKAGKRVFYSAIWNSNQGPVNVTLMLYKDQMASQIVCQQSIQPQTLSLNAITEFCDLVPLQQFGEEGEDLVQATIVVLGQAQVDTIQSYGEYLHSTEGLSSKENQLVQTEQMHEAIFMLLQLINGLKLSSLWAPKTNSYGRLCILQGLSDEVNCSKSTDEEQHSSLCKCAIKAVEILLPGEKLTPLLKEVLQEERAISLNQAKSVLEFMLWGPLDVVQGVPVEERELSLQRWLDLERATVLHGLVRTRVQLNVFEQLHLMFLVRSTAKTMCDASVLLEKANVY
ncbi:unnamed protein product [Parnassius apollo]|uniref:(apollo) hypothetical protein n=1 Tax=Parnassius apollo TaxID=110799 RepID=A0A8S3WQD0_PARAO|nr:unnamed protein product [Parnassius apollo]